MRVCILLAVLIGCSLAGRDETFFNDLQNSEFGKTVIQTVQLEMGSSLNSTPENVLNLLRQMQSDIQQEQSDDAAGLEDRQAGCVDNISSCASVITKANEKKADDERSFPLLQDEQQDKINQSMDKKEQEERNLDRIVTITEQRKETRDGYEERRDELSGLIATLQDAKFLIGQLNGGSFLQISDPIMSEIKKHQSKFLKSYPKQRGFHSFVSLMLEAVQDSGLKNTRDGTEQVVSIMQNLIESIYEVSKQELQADDQRQQVYLSSKTRLLQENAGLEGTIAYQGAQVEIITQKLLELINDIATQEQVADNKATEKKDWEQTCSDTQRAYEIQTNNRDEQMAIITQVIDIFENRFDNDISSYIQKIRID